jgi:hypothetical protein
MITNTREAVDALAMVDMGSAGKTELFEIVKFLRKKPGKLAEFMRGIRDASDASNSVTPYHRLGLVLKQALKEVK